MTKLTILHHDEGCVAIDKPPGLLVHPSNLDRHASATAMQLLRDQLGQLVYPVHRLDRPTSGVLLFGLSSETAASLCAEFRASRTEKTYLALVRGFCDDSGVIDRPLKDRFDKTDGPSRCDRPEREAITHYQTLHRFELPYPVGRYFTSRYSLVRIRPGTGRRHQIRRHLKHIAHPIIGDTEHGDHRHNRMFSAQLKVERMWLVATELKISYPASDQPLCIRAEPSGAMKRVLRQNGYDAI
jgi:tRNA pseudouridine65 synthase